MKNLLLTILILIAGFNLNAQYCTSIADTPYSHEIVRVAISNFLTSFSNETNCFSLIGTKGMASGLSNRYSDFTTDSNMTIPQLTRNSSYQLSVKTKNCSSIGYGGIRIAYIDYNHDGDFLDSMEKIIIDSVYSTDSIKTIDFSVPSGNYIGKTRLRIVYRFTTSISSMQSCGMTTMAGETEDYWVEIQNCNGYYGQKNVKQKITSTTTPCNGSFEIDSVYSNRLYLIEYRIGGTFYSKIKKSNSYNTILIDSFCNDSIYDIQITDECNAYWVGIANLKLCTGLSSTITPSGTITKSIGSSITLNSTGSTGYTSVQWFKNGLLIPGVNTQTLSIPNLIPNDSGCYFAKYFYSNGCTVNSNQTCLSIAATSTPKCSEFKNINYTKSGNTFAFTSSGSSTVPYPYTVRYTWTFSNGQTSTQKNPTTSFTSFPAWAKLKICIDSGTTTICCDSSMRDSITNCQMYCSITKMNDSLKVTATGGKAPRTYHWSTGVWGEKIKAVNAGTYVVTVTDSVGCTTTCYYIISSTNPCANYKNFTWTKTGNTYIFSANIPSNYIVDYTWKWDSNQVSTQAHPSITIPPGTQKTVRLKFCIRDSAQNIICCDSSDKIVSQTATPLPCNVKANFKWTVLSNGQIQFNDSTTPVTSQMYTYYWTFGDGTNSTQKNPLKTYATNGTKTVCLIARRWLNSNNMYCEDTICKNVTVTNASPCNRLEPRFTWTSTGGVYHFTHTTNLTGFNLVGLSYVVHNSNTTYTTANPTHTFTTNGTYSVTLTVVAYDVTSGTTCTKTITKTFYVNTSVCGCFKAYNTFTRTGMTAHFTNSSSCVDTTTQYRYKFGNGDTSNQASPNYTYPLPGLYRTVMYITRTVNGVTCKDSFVRIVQITTANPCKDSGYTTYYTQPCPSYHYPICGCDTVTYQNYCYATRAGIKQYTYGPCPNDTHYVKICGYVYRDINQNCAHDSFDQPLSGITIKFNTSPARYVYTNTAGYYQIYLPKGTYQISQDLTFRNPPVNQLCPASNASITVSATTGGTTYCNNNFYDTTSTCPDLAVSIHRVGTITPGFKSIKSIRYYNRGATPITGVVLKYRFLSALTVLSTTTATYTVSGNVITWNLGTIPAYSSGTKTAYLQTPTSLALGTAVVDSVWIEPVGGDCNPNNNLATYNDTCIGSYDPNDKTAYPATIIDTSVKSIDYLVRFQNTGTAPAHNVRIEDFIDANFEKASLKINDYSHTMNTHFDDNGKVYFEFPNIMLPDSGTDYEASQGFVSYTIHLKNNLPIGTQLKNTAEIYFDFNEAVVTNTTVNTIVLKSSSGVQTQIGGLNISLYPNPTNYNASFEVNIDKAQVVSYTLYDVQGKEVLSKSIKAKAGLLQETLHLNEFNSGIYILQLNINNQYQSIKIVKD